MRPLNKQDLVKVCKDDSGSTAAGGAPGSKPLELGVHVCVDKAAAGAVCVMEWAICAKQSAAAGGQYVAVVGAATNAFEACDEGWGSSSYLGAVAQPSDALQALRERHSKLLGDDGMRLRLEVTAMH